MEPTKKDVKAQDSFVIRHREPYWAYMNGQRAGTVHMSYVYEMHAESTYDAAHLLLAKAKEQVIWSEPQK